MSFSNSAAVEIRANTKEILERLNAKDDANAESLLEMLHQRDRQLRAMFSEQPDDPAPSEFAEFIREILELDASITAAVKAQQHQIASQLSTLQRGQSASRSYNSVQDE
jgi:uncharacterized membrane protein YccC